MAITKVEYYNGATKLGERTSSPFNQFLWTSPTLGSKSITARVFKDGALAFTTPVRNIVVSENPSPGDCTISIIAPASGAVFNEGESITFQGSINCEDGGGVQQVSILTPTSGQVFNEGDNIIMTGQISQI